LLVDFDETIFEPPCEHSQLFVMSSNCKYFTHDIAFVIYIHFYAYVVMYDVIRTFADLAAPPVLSTMQATATRMQPMLRQKCEWNFPSGLFPPRRLFMRRPILFWLCILVSFGRVAHCHSVV